MPAKPHSLATLNMMVDAVMKGAKVGKDTEKKILSAYTTGQRKRNKKSKAAKLARKRNRK